GGAVARRDHADPERPLLHELLEGRGRCGVAHRPRLDLHEDDVQLRLGLRADGQPAEAAVHGQVGADFETELVAVELEGLVLVGDVDGGVTEALDHGAPVWLGVNGRNQSGGIVAAVGGGRLLGNCYGPTPANWRAKHDGMNTHGALPGTVTQARTRRRNAMGEQPTWRLNSVQKDPREENPTSKQTSVTDRLVTVSRWRARSRRRRV